MTTSLEPQVTPASKPKRAHRATRYTEVKYHSFGRALLASDRRPYHEKKALTGIPKDVLRRFAAGTQHPNLNERRRMACIGIGVGAWNIELNNAWLDAAGVPVATCPQKIRWWFEMCLSVNLTPLLREHPFRGTIEDLAKSLGRPVAFVGGYLNTAKGVNVTIDGSGEICVDWTQRVQSAG